MKKRGVFFSIDALIAIIIIIAVILIAYPALKESKQETEIHSDILISLSTLKVGEINNTYIKNLVSSGEINNTNKSILEQIGEFYVKDIIKANALAEAVLSELNITQNIGIWYGNTLIWSRNSTPYETAKNVETVRQIISGIQEGGNITGFSARSFLANNQQTRYAYFGGYIGDGNITSRIEYYGNITSALMEIAVSNNFTLYINGISSGNFNQSADEFTPKTYNLPIQNFKSGTNLIDLKGKNLRIAGGFIKITYQQNYSILQSTKYYFPGIHGLINLYDSLYIPGNLVSIDISLHMNTSLEAFLIIGNTTVFRNITQGEKTITIQNSTLASMLNYNLLGKKTIPIRLGLENLSYVVNTTLDIVSVADLSTSMACSIAGGNCGNGPGQCAACGGSWLLPLNKSREAHYTLINKILALKFSRVGIIGYHVSVPTSNSHSLSNNSAELNSTIDSWDATALASENRKLCEAIKSTVTEFQTNSNPNATKVAIVMSAGSITHGCSDVSAGDLNFNNVVNDPGDQAIKLVCDAYNNYNITFHSVAYGNSADIATLQIIAECGKGNFYSSNIADLPNLYKQVMSDIFVRYNLQTISSNIDITTRLYPDSYINLNYQQEYSPYGLIITIEKKFDNETSAQFSIPPNSTILEAKVASYSGPRWTNMLRINNILAYNLSAYGLDYTKLGDPFVLDIPKELININNSIILTTGFSPAIISTGSKENKVITKIVKNITAYSKISANKNGCIWTIQFEDNTNITIPVPSQYLGAEICRYTENSIVYNDNDATQNAVFKLLQLLDLNNNNKIDIKFDQQDLKIDLTDIIGIPYTWSTEVQARIWY